MKTTKEAVVSLHNEREELVAIIIRDHKSNEALIFKTEKLGVDEIAELFAEASSSKKELHGSKAVMNSNGQPKRTIDMETGEDKRP